MIDRSELDLSLYLVTDSGLSQDRSLDWIVEEAVKGGVTVVQLREKDLNTRDFLLLAKRLKFVLKRFHIPLIINDRIDIALASGADGVHIGQSDMPYLEARRLLGENAIIGLSLESYEQIEEANGYDLDYVAVSPVFTTSTKKELTIGLGLAGIREFSDQSKHPCLGIGGIHLSNATQIIEAGAVGIAVVSEIVSASDPQQVARELMEILKSSTAIKLSRLIKNGKSLAKFPAK